MTRPQINASLVELEKMFDADSESPLVLEQLFAELIHRKSRGARVLLSRVSASLAELEEGGDDPRVIESGPSGEPIAGASGVFPSHVEPVGPHPDDQRRPKQLALIRPPGTPGLPDAWERPLKRDLSIKVGADADLPDRFVAALRALISEMKRSGSGQKRYELEKGLRIDSTQSEFIYAFPFVDEVELFEDAQVEIETAGRRVEGSIVSISAGQLVIAIKEDLGDELRRTVLLIDATALIAALAEKIEQTKNGQVTLNRELADAVAGSRPTPDDPLEIKSTSPSLNEGQRAAYDRARTASVTWIMGPPGTGKTTTLGEIVRAAFEDDRRVLVCSNTNKAVDEVLVKICEVLKPDHAAMQEGRVVRLGRIVHDKLRDDFAAFVTVDGIAERLSKELNERRRTVEVNLEDIDEQAKGARSVVARFDALERAEKALADAIRQVNGVARDGRQAKSDLNANEGRRLKLQTELKKRGNTFFRFLKRPEDLIKRDLHACAARRLEIESRIAGLADAYRRARTEHETAAANRHRCAHEVASEDRSAAILLLKKLDRERDPLVAELREIEEKTAALRASILKEARVVGTTCTKAYLSAQDIGQADMVIIDEASMVMLPMAWFAAGLARERVVICGDFRQIPPIVQSEQEAIVGTIGLDAFAANNVQNEDDKRLVYLDEQHRMDPLICDLISGPMYNRRLRTASNRDAQDCIVSGALVPPPFNQTLTVIDTSDLWPFESQTAFYSRFNLMHALLARNLAWHFRERGAIASKLDLGICTPYAAQSKLIQKLIEGEGLEKLVQVGTVHRYQGDERRMMLLDIPESHGGGWNLGRFVQGLPPAQIGARLINVAISRAQCRLLVMANLTYLDKKLPSTSLLRSILFDMQERGNVVRGAQVLALRPIETDLSGLIHQMPFEQITETLGLFDEEAFERALEHDIKAAKESVVVFSGYVTPSRVGKLGDLFRTKLAEGVRIRCVTRPPQTNGSIPRELGRQALDMLEGIGVTVDCRANIHQKVCLIDNRIVWMGSLNALSHAGRSDETMTRAVNDGYGAAVAAHMSRRRISAEKAAASVAEAENPRCPDCGSRTTYCEGRFGPYYRCSECKWSAGQRQLDRGTGPVHPNRLDMPTYGPPCPKCDSPTRLRSGRFGVFYGCTRYPDCGGTVDAGGP